jgi:magnesium-transporting ATPase (P-type)
MQPPQNPPHSPDQGMWSRIRSSRWRSLGVSVLLVLPVALIISAQMVDHINSMEGIEAFFSMIMFASSVTIAVCLLCRTIYRGPLARMFCYGALCSQLARPFIPRRGLLLQ